MRFTKKELVAISAALIAWVAAGGAVASLWKPLVSAADDYFPGRGMWLIIAGLTMTVLALGALTAQSMGLLDEPKPLPPPPPMDPIPERRNRKKATGPGGPDTATGETPDHPAPAPNPAAESPAARPQPSVGAAAAAESAHAAPAQSAAAATAAPASSLPESVPVAAPAPSALRAPGAAHAGGVAPSAPVPTSIAPTAIGRTASYLPPVAGRPAAGAVLPPALPEAAAPKAAPAATAATAEPSISYKPSRTPTDPFVAVARPRFAAPGSAGGSQDAAPIWRAEVDRLKAGNLVVEAAHHAERMGDGELAAQLFMEAGEWLDAGRAAREAGRLDLAAQALERANRPAEAALTYWSIGNAHDAARMFQRDYERNPDREVALLLLRSWMTSRNYSTAVDWLFTRVAPQGIAQANAALFYRYARLAEDAGSILEALSLYEELATAGALAVDLAQRHNSLKKRLKERIRRGETQWGALTPPSSPPPVAAAAPAPAPPAEPTPLPVMPTAPSTPEAFPDARRGPRTPEEFLRLALADDSADPPSSPPMPAPGATATGKTSTGISGGGSAPPSSSFAPVRGVDSPTRTAAGTPGRPRRNDDTVIRLIAAEPPSANRLFAFTPPTDLFPVGASLAQLSTPDSRRKFPLVPRQLSLLPDLSQLSLSGTLVSGGNSVGVGADPDGRGTATAADLSEDGVTPGTPRAAGVGRAIQQSRFPGEARYELSRELRRTFAGALFDATDRRTQRRVLLHAIDAPLAAPTAWETAFVEWESLSRAPIPGLPALLDAGVMELSAFVVYEWMDFVSLEASIRSHGRFSEDDALQLVLRLGIMLGRAHRRGIAHRTLSTTNLLLRRDGTSTLVGFGEGLLNPPPTPQPPPGTPLDTPPPPALQPPERDIAGLGALFASVVIGREVRPLTTAQPFEFPADDLAKLKEAVSPESYDWFLFMTASDPSRRYAHLGDVATDLRRILTRRGVDLARAGTGAAS